MTHFKGFHFRWASLCSNSSDKEFFVKWMDKFLYTPDYVFTFAFWARVITFVGLILWSVKFIKAGVDWEVLGSSFMHSINLPFHEFGHIFFRPFGKFMHILGGSLFQVAMPLGLMLYFVLKEENTFAGSVTLWWSGQSFIDLSPYIDDAIYRSLPLVGGGGEESHDWGNLLTMTNQLHNTHAIAKVSFYIGVILILLALFWGALLLLEQRKKLVG